MKPLVLLIAGWAHPASVLRPLADALADFASPRLFAADESLPELGEPAFLLGWSLGGLRSLYAALHAPEKFPGLILVGATARFCAAPDFPYGVATARLRAMKTALRKTPEPVLRQFFADVAAPAQLTPADLEEKVQAALTLGVEKLVTGLDELLATDLRANLSGNATPALMLHGRADRVIPCAAGEALAQQFVFSRFAAFDGVGHDLPLRAPEKLAVEIKNFLETF
ncbi:MAG: alpha/beta fold hydrolase [Kiritimatiellaeota bacterium]|nr:alpha/beta fold hydrolase [Kiritimatiellota bacterium]